jgi:hypothetical protein
MTPHEMLVLQHGQEKIDKAKAIARDCPTGYVIVLDRKTGQVFYRDADSQIPTDFTEEHVRIAHSFPPGDPARIERDRLNSEASGGKFDVYTVRGK